MRERRELFRLYSTRPDGIRRPSVRRGDMRRQFPNFSLSRRQMTSRGVLFHALAHPSRKRIPPFEQIIIMLEYLRFHLPRNAVQIGLRRLTNRCLLDAGILLRRHRGLWGLLLGALKHRFRDAGAECFAVSDLG